MSRKLLISILFLFITVAIFAQDTKKNKAQEIQNIINSRRFIFIADYVYPMRGGAKALTSEYSLKILKDTIISDLPYFGRAYAAPIDVSDGGIKFMSTNFKYVISDAKKGKKDIDIKPTDTREVKQLFLTVFENGSASLNVTSLNRQPISYKGYIKAVQN